MEGVKPLPGSVSQGNRDSFNSAYIFILNDRYPRAGKAGKGQRQRGLGRPGPTKHITVLRSSTFQRGFFLHGEGQSRFNRDDVPRSWERQKGSEGGGNMVRSRVGVVMRAGEGFIGRKGRGLAKRVSVWLGRHNKILDLFDPSQRPGNIPR